MRPWEKLVEISMLLPVILSLLSKLLFCCKWLDDKLCTWKQKWCIFFQHDGRGILYTAMKQRGMSVRQLNWFYTVKWYLDVLKRRACGRYFSMDPTVIQMMKSATLRPLLHPLSSLARNTFCGYFIIPITSTDDEGIRTCDLFFLNADKFISDGISQILTRVQSIDTVPMN